MRNLAFAGVLSLILLITAACNSKTDAPPAATTAHFILASDHGLTEITDGREREIASIEAGAFALDPALSPDSKQIAFIVQPPVAVAPGGSIDFGSDLYVVDRNGGQPKLLLKHSAVGEFIRTPSWLHDGTLLVTVRGRSDIGGFDLHIINLDPASGAQKRVLESAIDPVVSPDGRSAAYIALDDSTGTEALTIGAAPSFAHQTHLAGTTDNIGLVSAAVWSPDGSRLAFAAIDTSQPLATPAVPGASPGSTQHPFAQDVWIIDRDGKNLHRLSELADNMPTLGWSLDGTRVYSLGVTGFWRLDVATGDREQLQYDGAIGQLIWLGP